MISHHNVVIDQTLWTPSSDIFFDETATTLLGTYAEPLAELDHAHAGTVAHSEAVARMAAELAQRTLSTEREIRTVIRSGMVHDLGKKEVGAKILDKPSKLDPDEWSLVKQHPTNSFRKIMLTTGDATVATLALLHHTYQGNAYPSPSERQALYQQFGVDSDIEQDPLIQTGGTILALADAFVAITDRTRPYLNRQAVVDRLTIAEGSINMILENSHLGTDFADNVHDVIGPLSARLLELEMTY